MNMTRILASVNQWKHLILLLSLVVLIFTQPAAQRNEPAEITYSIVFSLGTLVIFLAVFDSKWRRIIALCLASPTLITHWLVRAFSLHEDLAAVAIEHAAAALFLAFAVTVILRDIFKSERIDADHILGAVCGYLLAGIAWGNLYFLVETLGPGSFAMTANVADQLKQNASKRYLLDYFSFVTLTCYGDTKLTPVAATASSLTFLETIFGQFYMAVLVAQLVGLRLSQAISRSSRRDG
jgi:voltage-gated potassium channel